VSTPALTPLYWHGAELVPISALEPLDEAATGSLTILHTNDFHSSIDARPGSACGGLARIATTIESTRAAGPTLVVDAGDSVFGGGTWWCAGGAGATGRLLGVAGYDLAAIGNHDLEHGPRGLHELLEGGHRMVASNLVFEDDALRQKIAPAYVAAVDGLQIGLLGLTTTMTQRLVPSSVLHGVHFENTLESLLRTIASLAPMVHSIVILSHMGFDHDDTSDIHIVPALRNTRVSAILGGHTHDALDPSVNVDGITTSNAGAYGVNVNKVTLTRNAHGSLEVRAKLLPQDQRVPESERLLAARAQELQAILPLREDRLRLPDLAASQTMSSGVHKDREWGLLTEALRAADNAATDGIQMVPYLYVLGQLPEADMISHLDVLTAYPNAEQLVEIAVQGAQLKQLIELQARLVFYFAAVPVWVHDGRAVALDELDDDRTYQVIVSELVAEGGLDWTVLRGLETPARPLGVTCAELVWNYLRQPVRMGMAS
jgi:5'-nucleotidase